MIVEDTGCPSDYRSAIAEEIKCKSETRSPIVFVPREALRDIQRILRYLNIGGGQRDPRKRISKGRRSELLRDFVVISQTEIDRYLLGNLKRVLSKKSDRAVFQRAVRLAKSLDKDARETQAVGLNSRKSRAPLSHRQRYRIAA